MIYIIQDAYLVVILLFYQYSHLLDNIASLLTKALQHVYLQIRVNSIPIQKFRQINSRDRSL